ncbi:MAG: hypothetical protein B7Z47_01310 [Chthoniobacter sp. 12-60-6]|nr:MAG: hypothetical protein B7Z47_01310 [Chthoniobacter sp. 12-60-6]
MDMKTKLEFLQLLREAALVGTQEPESEKDEMINSHARANREFCNELTDEQRSQLTHIALASVYGSNVPSFPVARGG